MYSQKVKNPFKVWSSISWQNFSTKLKLLDQLRDLKLLCPSLFSMQRHLYPSYITYTTSRPMSLDPRLIILISYYLLIRFPSLLGIKIWTWTSKSILIFGSCIVYVCFKFCVVRCVCVCVCVVDMHECMLNT